MNVDTILGKALRGERIGLEEGAALFASDQVEKIGAAANEIMLRKHPDPITTFVIGRNINYTNVCDVYCRFCAFYRSPDSEEGYVLPNEAIFQKMQELIDVGGTEVLMQGGVNPNLPFDYYLNLLREIKQRFPSLQMHSFSTVEIRKMQELSGLSSTEEVLKKLHEAGLDSLPGAGAEMLVDRIRNKISRRKGSWQEWIDTMKAAHRVGMHTTGTMVIGFGETAEERALHLIRLRDAQDECLRGGYPTPGFLAFIAWTFQPDNTNLKAERVGAEEYLKTVAIARIMLDNIDNLQSSWVTMGPEVGKLSLSYGCNDFGSTMMEENVVSAAACTHKVNTNLILDLIREAGKIPAQRNTKYELLRVFQEGERADKDFVLQN
ncbi:dehypoxanthine futalosine cyclase [Xylanibacillus composti]|uniref:Cyclic dehypoxanthine futalosine synthase n=1 Tax=Xylanibacillus composti TaxID=1572762 RepID=A0A8J4H7L9_9BACL|nr:cyclic dehypoxanthinyl futalosine synthase [Xylanibacillus composti]MDT9724707.1 dehypoxanthine futalosine cyclase [Xylanibacillus composti]GIQ70313.1 cyclic dehypoxanthine futalosine synthase [Xylanibacillus composti]